MKPWDKPKRLVVGNTVEYAIWLDGMETPEMRAQFEKDIHEAISEVCRLNGVISAPPRFVEKFPGEERVPLPPKDISGPAIRLLVAEADIVMRTLEKTPGSFLLELDPVDLERLRRITKRTHRAYLGDGVTPRPLTAEEVDKIIEDVGPQVAAKLVREAVDHGKVN